MLCVDWRGPLPLSVEYINSALLTASPAVAVLGAIDFQGDFIIRRVVRSDSDIRTDLARFLGVYGFCKVMPCKSPAEAYVLECELYHRARPKDCAAHPGEPGGLNVVCPFCGFRLRPREVA